jgi:hypothetical protein
MDWVEPLFGEEKIAISMPESRDPLETVSRFI